MADRMTPEQRHRCMSHIRGKDTRPEWLVRRYLYAHGFRYRLHVSKLPGKPDIVLRRLHTVILVNGCFWHGHEGCRLYVIPKTRTQFWQAKIERNQARDLRDREQLTRLGWNVITLWECQLAPTLRQRTLASLIRTLSQIELRLATPFSPTHSSPSSPSLAPEFDIPIQHVADDGDTDSM